MSRFGGQIAFGHWQDDLEVVEVDADNELQAEAAVREAFTGIAFAQRLQVPIVQSIEVWEIPQRRYALDLSSDSEDLDVSEVSE